ncbi:MAG: hypothetical protein WAU68_14645 [Vitreimonas sp.]
MLDEALLAFIKSSLRSVWALELLLLLRLQAPRAFTIEEAARELRATASLVANCLPQLESAGLIAGEDGAFKFSPASPALQELCALLDVAYRERPVAIIAAIMSSSDTKLQGLADAFRFKDKDK